MPTDEISDIRTEEHDEPEYVKKRIAKIEHTKTIATPRQGYLFGGCQPELDAVHDGVGAGVVTAGRFGYLLLHLSQWAKKRAIERGAGAWGERRRILPSPKDDQRVKQHVGKHGRLLIRIWRAAGGWRGRTTDEPNTSKTHCK